VLAFLTDATVFVRDEATAVRLRPHLDAYSGYNLMVGHSVAVFGSANRYLGKVDSLLGEPSATEHLERALEMDRASGSILHEAESLAALADHLAAEDPERAAQCRSEAGRLAELGGLARVLSLLQHDATPTELPSGLTLRELDVLRLLADGLSNREIAERLFISPHTAANHVRSIMTKTGTSNRTQAAMFAADTGLLG